jgi:hypothetical protein
MTFDPERMAAHRAMLEAAGYTRSSIYLSPIARRVVESNRRRGETLTIVINRLIVGERPEPPRETAAEAREWQRRIRRAQNEIRHSRRAATWGGPITLSHTLYREDRKGGAIVTADDAIEFGEDDVIELSTDDRPAPL